MRNIVGGLENVVLLEANLAHVGVDNLGDGFFLFDELLDAPQAHVHSCDRLLDGLLYRFKIHLGCLAPDLITRWRVSHHAAVPLHVLLVLRHALLAQGLVVLHAEGIDGQVMFRANCILLNGVHLRTHVTLHHLRRPMSW